MRSWMVLTFGVLIVGLLNFGVLQKERVALNGDQVFLKLRPVDPRSLLQGDYMRLGFDIEEQAGPGIREEKRRSGNLIIQVDGNRVGEYVKLDDGLELANNEYGVHFTNVSWQPTLVPNSFFFQEGEGDKFEDAKFAVLLFGPDRRDYVLVGLADEHREMINPRETLGIELPAFLQ